MIDVAFVGGMAEVLGEPDESTFDGDIPAVHSGGGGGGDGGMRCSQDLEKVTPLDRCSVVAGR